MDRLKTAFEWAGIALGVLVLGFWAIESDLIRVLIPVGAVFLLLLGLAGGLAVLRRSSLGLGTAVVFIVSGVYIFFSARAGFSEQTLWFQNNRTNFEGTLYLPEGAGPHPAAVIVHGSLCLPRRIYHPVAVHLARSGIAVFSFDKRGTGKSGGNCETENNSSFENLQLLADDVYFALETLSQRPEIEPTRLGLWGVSQGGWIAPLAAEKYPPLAFMVLVSGPSVSVGEENYYSTLTGDGHENVENALSQEEIENLVEEKAPSGFDPYETLLKIEVPTLWVFGGQDQSIPVKKSIERLEALKATGKTYEIALYPEASHALLVMTFPYRFSPGYQDRVARWINQQVSKNP